MTDVITVPDLRALTDEQLAGAWREADVDDPAVYAAFLAEFDQRTAAERMARARRVLDGYRAEGEQQAYANYRAADDWCRGELLNKAGKAAVRDEWELWRMPEERALRLCSDELAEFWRDVAPRVTPAGYVRQRAAQSRMEREAARDAAFQSWEKGNRNDHGRPAGLAGPETSPFQPGPAAGETPQAGPGRFVHCGGRGDSTAEGQEAGTDAADGGAGGPVQPVGREDMEPQPASLAPAASRRMPLDEARKFAGEIWWTSEVHLDVYTAALAASHTIGSFSTVPRVLIKSKDKRTGKTTGTDLAEMLGHNAWRVTTSTGPGLKAKFNEAEPPLIICEEIQKRFGHNGLTGSKDPLATFLLDGYRCTAVTPLSVDRTTVDIPSYCMAVLNGRGRAVADDIEDRCIILSARRKPPAVTMPRNSLDVDTRAEAGLLRDALHAYVKALEPVIARLQRRWRRPHPLFTDRLDQVWRPVYLIAAASDVYERELWEKACAAAAEQGAPDPPEPACDWAERVMSGFRLLALDNSDVPPLESAQAMLRDAARWFRGGGGWKDSLGRRFGFAADLKAWLADESGEQLWTQLTERRMEQIMTEALGETVVLTRNVPGEVKRRARGWAAAPVLAGWDALEATWLPQSPDAPEEVSIFDDLPPEDDGDTEADHSRDSTDADSPTPLD